MSVITLLHNPNCSKSRQTLALLEERGAQVQIVEYLRNPPSTEELGQILVKQLKNRYNDPTMNKRFVIGIDRSKMLLYDVQIKEQDDLVDSGQEPVFDKTSFGTKFKDSKYEDFKV